MMRWLVCVWACMAPTLGQESDARAATQPGPDREGQAAGATGLPRAQPERWAQWRPGPEPLASVAEPYLAAVRLYQEGYLPRSIEGAFGVLRLEPDYPPALLLAAAACFRLQRYGEAVELYERLLDHAPGELARTRQLGHCLHSLGRSAEALEHYDRLLAAEPGDLLARRARGVVRLRLGQVPGALEDFRAVLEARPGDPEALYWKASALFDDEREGALAAARAARDAAPYTARTWYLVAQSAGEEGEQEESEEARARHTELAAAEAAIHVVEQRLLVEPGDLEAREKLARLRLGIGDFRRARIAYGQLLRAAERAGDAEVAARARRSLEAQQSLGR